MTSKAQSVFPNMNKSNQNKPRSKEWGFFAAIARLRAGWFFQIRVDKGGEVWYDRNERW